MRFTIKLARVKDGSVVSERKAVLTLSAPRRKLDGSRGKTHDAVVEAGKLKDARTLSLKAARKLNAGASVPFWFRGHQHAVTRVRVSVPR